MTRPNPRAQKSPAAPQADFDRGSQFQLEALQPRILLSACLTRDAAPGTPDYTPAIDAGFAIGEPAPDGSEALVADETTDNSGDIRPTGQHPLNPDTADDETITCDDVAVDATDAGPNTTFPLNPGAAGDESSTDVILMDTFDEVSPTGIFYTLGGEDEPTDPAADGSEDFIFYSMGADGLAVEDAGEIPADSTSDTDVPPDCVLYLGAPDAEAGDTSNLEDPVFFQIPGDETTSGATDVHPDGIFHLRPPEDGETFEDLAAVQTPALLDVVPVPVPAPSTTPESSSDKTVVVPPAVSAVPAAIVNPLLSKSDDLLATSGSIMN